MKPGRISPGDATYGPPMVTELTSIAISGKWRGISSGAPCSPQPWPQPAAIAIALTAGEVSPFRHQAKWSAGAEAAASANQALDAYRPRKRRSIFEAACRASASWWRPLAK